MEEARFEALGPERFQRFCQSLFSYEHPGLQALEVGMPDGGRDAFSRHFGSENEADDYAVFQVKYARSPAALDDPLEWIEKVVKGELPKIEDLATRGASSYQLMTNVVGTPHRDGGSVDKVGSYLEKALPIPARCWWRNDLEVRLAKHAELRWGYPELLNPSDILKVLVEGGLSEHAHRRTLAIRSFLAKQYDDERKVRFKQADLPRNDLLGLFVDVPVETSYGKGRRGAGTSILDETFTLHGEEGLRPGPVGAARLLLDPDAQETMGKVVVEGAPGQGKSTLGQYLSQVHRMRLLKKAAIRGIPPEHRRSPARLPFKVDLRQFAVFLRGKDPFASEPGWGGLPQGWPRSLEGYLAALVRLGSGGATFDVSDLQAVAEASHLLLVLDGLDEVAEIDDRALVVEAVRDGCTRLEETALGLQVVVTSRPAAFTNSPTLSDRSFQYLTLAALTPALAREYSAKWTGARGLPQAEAKDVEESLSSQMHKDHIRDLSRNPMQLAILLNLILTKGESLPDKRTDLYTRYIDVFFDREAEKSKVVRKHRDTLLALHSHLGWKLHAEAELSSSGGTIGEDELKLEVRDYLEREGEDVALVDELFKGVVDRIFALVSRVEGRFEFEVQPVREYFAARHLYSTAQLSRVGDEHPGTRPDRFDGLVRNAYWLNVARFYAGFYDAGEQASLADRLEALASDEVFVFGDRAWALAATFLRDWSFSLARQSRERAIELALADLGRRHDLAQRDPGLVKHPPLVLPKGSGLEQLNERCWTLLDEKPPADRRTAIAQLLDDLPSDLTLPQIRERLRNSSGKERTSWLRLAARLDATAALDGAALAFLGDDGCPEDLGRRAAALVEAGHAGLVERDEAMSRALAEGLIEGTVFCANTAAHESWLGTFGELFAQRGRTHRLHPSARLDRLPSGSLCPTAAAIRDSLVSLFLRRDEPYFFHPPWDAFTEECRQRWGEGWGLAKLALFDIAGRGRPERAGRRVDLADPAAPLLRRLRYARTRGGVKSGAWWTEQLEAASTELDRKIAIATAATWPSGAALEQVLPALERELRSFKGDDLLELCSVVDRLSRFRGSGRVQAFDRETLDSLSTSLTVLLANRDPTGLGAAAFDSRLRDYRGGSKAVLAFCLRSAASRVLNGRKDLLGTVRRNYRAAGDYVTYRVDRNSSPAAGPPPELARRIVADAGDFPFALVNVAEARCSAEALESIPPLLLVAQRENWFAE